MEVLKRDGSLLYMFTERTKEMVLAAVRQNGKALQYAPEYNADKEVVLAAVKNNGIAIQFASPELQYNKEVVLASVKNSVYALHSFLNDVDVMLVADHRLPIERKAEA